MDVMACEACGGMVVFDTRHEAVRCLFCGDVSLAASELIGGPQPQRAVPFDVSENDARALFRSWARASWWTPKALRDQSATVDRMWVPAWRVEARVEATWTGLVDTRTTRSGKRPDSGTDSRTREAWVPASMALSQAELSALAPFPKDQTVAWDAKSADAPFEVGGLSEQAAVAAARGNLRHAVRNELIRHRRLRDCRVSVLLDDVRSRPLMLPIYVGCVRYRDRPWRFVINGQTGRVTGESPLDRTKFAVVVALAVAGLLLWLMWRESGALWV